MTEETTSASAAGTGDTGGAGDGASNASEGGTTTTPNQRRRRRRGGRGRGGGGGGGAKASATGTTSTTKSADAADDGSAASPKPKASPQTKSDSSGTEKADGAGEAKTSTAARRRRRRGGRGRGGGGAKAATAAKADSDEGSDNGSETTAAKTENASSDGSDVGADAGAATEEKAPAKTATRTRRRRSRSSSSSSKTQEAKSAAKTEEKPVEKKPAEKKSTRSSRGGTKQKEAAPPTRTARRVRTPGRRRREPQPVTKRTRDKIMLITEHGDRDQIAVVEGRDLIEHYITRVGAHSMVGNIYQGRVQNVLPGMEAAFVDVGRGRNAVLYAGEVNWDEEVEGQARRIEQALKPGQGVLVQVTKDPMGGKGARLTGEISIPGRFLVLVPNSQVSGLSRRLEDSERRRLRAIVKKLKPESHGLIVRTAADGASEEDLRADVDRLVETWKDIEKKAKRAKPPKVLYEEPELTVRVVRDLFNDEEFTEIVTESVPIHDMVRSYLQQVAPDLAQNVRLHEGPLPLFEEFHILEQIHKALERKVWLPSGGYIVIDRTEAMTVIDVNTGRHVGKTNLEETVVKTNVEAAEEIARQLRLRDIGGMIIIDFIDMLFEQNKEKVIKTLKDALAQDKTRSQVFDISPLGLLEVTRKRVSAGLLESFSETCPTCEGRGILITHDI